MNLCGALRERFGVAKADGLAKTASQAEYAGSIPVIGSTSPARTLFETFDSRPRCHDDVTTRLKVSPAAFKAVVLRVRIEPHRQTGVLVSDPRRDQRHRPMALKPVSSGVAREPVRGHARPQMFAEPCPLRTSSIKAYDGADEGGDVLLVDVRCVGPPVSEPIAFLTLVSVR